MSLPAPSPRPRASRRAFTLIELLTVIAIIGILAAIIIPTVGRVRDSAARTDCASNQRQIGQALLLYAQDNRQNLPRVTSAWPPSDQKDTWCYSIWTYLGYNADSFDATTNGFTSNATTQGTNLFHCSKTRNSPTYGPGVPNNGTGWTSYGLNDGPLYGSGLANRVNPVALTRVQTPSKTAMVLESRFYWANDYAYKTQFGLIPHGERSNVVFYDGHVELLAWDEIQARGGEERLFWSGRGAW